MPVIEVENLSFIYGQGRGVHHVSFSVAKTKILGLLGPNGGGKTTVFRILCTLLAPEEGRVRISGWDTIKNPFQVRRLIGVVFQSNSLDLKLTTVENLLHQGHLYGLRGAKFRQRVEELLGRFGLTERRHDLVERLSGGLRRRLEVAKGLLHRPSILILDEPTQGLDPGARLDLWDYLMQLRSEEAMTILLTTHLMEEAERCDHLVILSEGKVVARGSPEVLKEKIGGDVIVVQTRHPERLCDQIKEKFACQPMVVNGTVRLERRRGHEFITQLVESFPGQIEAVTVGKPTLEDVFVHETGHRFWET